MANKLVSILIPVFNRENLIEETVQSALHQTYKNIEIIIVDNKSTDNTWEVLQKLVLVDERVKVFQNETNIGPVKNWKRCIDEASGEYGKILFSDDLMEETYIEDTITFLEDSLVGFVFTGREIFQNNSERTVLSYMAIGETGIYPSGKYINGVLFEKNYPNSPGCALFRLKDLKTNLLVQVPNKINSDFGMHAIGSDLLIFLITASQYEKFAFVDKKLVRFRAHSNSITIDSGSGKLLLMYAVAKAFFIENYLHDTKIVEKFNNQLKSLLLQFDGAKFGLNRIDDFYMKNTNFRTNIYSDFVMFGKYVKKIFYTKIKVFLK